MSQAEAQTKLDRMQITNYDAISLFPSRAVPSDWLLQYQSDKPLIPWQFANLAFDANWPHPRFDWDGTGGQLAIFLSDLRNTCRVTQQIGSNSIALDLELGVNYDWGIMATAVPLSGVSESEFIVALQNLGSLIADVLNAELSGGTVWGIQIPVVISQNWLSAYYIFQGLIASLDPEITFIAGAEAEINYVHELLATFAYRMDVYKTEAKSLPANVKLATPLVIWNHKDQTGSWLRTWLDAHPGCEFTTLNDFKPLLRLMREQFDYAWIYNYPTATGWSPHEQSGQPVHDLLAELKWSPVT
jgi:hypothetical protein